MKLFFLSAIIIILSISSIYSQTFRLGAAANFLTSNKYLNYQFGPSIVAEYKFKDIPISLQGTLRGYLTELSNENNFAGSYSMEVINFGFMLNYFPINWAIEPYVGVGTFYNFNSLSLNGNLSRDFGVESHSPGDLNNNFSLEITSGIKFSAQTPINFIAEVTQTINKPEYQLKMVDKDNNRTAQKAHFDFNSLFIRFGLLFQL